LNECMMSVCVVGKWRKVYEDKRLNMKENMELKCVKPDRLAK